jgi:hypothetical protein
MRFKFGAIAIALLLVLVAAGCGKKKVAVVTPPTTTSVTTTTATTTSGGNSGGSTTTTAGSTTTNSGKPSFASVKDCAQLESIGKKFSSAVQSATASGSKLDLSKEVSLIKELAAASPSEIRGDFETVATAFESAATALQKAGITAGKTPTADQLLQLEAAGKSFSSPKVATAEQHLESWATKNCGGLTTTN